MLESTVNVPGPRRRYEPLGFAAAHLEMAALSEATEVLEATGTGIPAWVLLQADRTGGVHGFAVVSPSGRVAGSPAFDQSIARLFAMIPDQGGVPALALGEIQIAIREMKLAKERLIFSLMLISTPLRPLRAKF
jgi:hypothetical protein